MHSKSVTAWNAEMINFSLRLYLNCQSHAHCMSSAAIKKTLNSICISFCREITYLLAKRSTAVELRMGDSSNYISLLGIIDSGLEV